MDLDVEAFIHEVQLRPAIWDASTSEYSNRDRKKKAWEELINVFMSNNEAASNEEKNEIGVQLLRRWKSLRDSYSRELKLQKEQKSGSAPRKRSVYLFFKQLSFLEKVTSSKNTTSSLADENQDMTAVRDTPLPKKFKTKNGPIGERLVSAVERSVNDRAERENHLENDCDRMFLLSLLQPLKQIPEHARFGIKRTLMNVIESAMKMYVRTPLIFQRQDNPSAHVETPQHIPLQNVSINYPSYNIASHSPVGYPLEPRPSTADDPCDVHSNVSSYSNTSARSPFSDLDIFDVQQ